MGSLERADLQNDIMDIIKALQRQSKNSKLKTLRVSDK